ncbi:hypothetical protein [Roseibium sp. MMSF_3412]|uniref:DUF6896 domain-containing protein n=1 Tax=Roseibium sp. MMSF_3412 TaxID=3046712 RepID=UPI00273D8F7F|nr:hypothetical protein [Roseibium sp. MMSF_3412]
MPNSQLEQDYEFIKCEFLVYQQGLLEAFRNAFPVADTSDELSYILAFKGKYSVTGTLMHLGSLWGYHLHGAGVRFINIASLTIVDVHDRVLDPWFVDFYRLEIFVETSEHDFSEDQLIYFMSRLKQEFP